MSILYGLKYFLLNKIVCHIPIWWFRKLLYQLAGMKIGHAHILMDVITDGWKGIEIGDGVCINQRVHLDGRGGLKIKNNVSISIGTIILTQTHATNSNDFHLENKPVIIEDRVWTGANSIILPGSILKEGAVLAAGSVAIGKVYDEYTIYSGVPAKKIGDRNKNIDYDLSKWWIFFR